MLFNSTTKASGNKYELVGSMSLSGSNGAVNVSAASSSKTSASDISEPAGSSSAIILSSKLLGASCSGSTSDSILFSTSAIITGCSGSCSKMGTSAAAIGSVDNLGMSGTVFLGAVALTGLFDSSELT